MAISAEQKLKQLGIKVPVPELSESQWAAIQRELEAVVLIRDMRRDGLTPKAIVERLREMGYAP